MLSRSEVLLGNVDFEVFGRHWKVNNTIMGETISGELKVRAFEVLIQYPIIIIQRECGHGFMVYQERTFEQRYVTR